MFDTIYQRIYYKNQTKTQICTLCITMFINPISPDYPAMRAVITPSFWVIIEKNASVYKIPMNFESGWILALRLIYYDLNEVCSTEKGIQPTRHYFLYLHVWIESTLGTLGRKSRWCSESSIQYVYMARGSWGEI